MSLLEPLFETECHPIDLMEMIAADQDWEVDRVGENQLALAIEGQWRSYALTVAWSEADQSLRLLSSFEMEPPTERLDEIMRAVNAANERSWIGSFAWWESENLMIYRYTLLLDGGQSATSEQLDRMIRTALATCERFYPAFQLVGWANRSAQDAMEIAMLEAYGHA